MAIVSSSKEAHWSYPATQKDRTMNPKFWANNDPEQMIGGSLKDAVVDAFNSPQSYDIGCALATGLVPLKGIIKTYDQHLGQGTFDKLGLNFVKAQIDMTILWTDYNADDTDWVPGDAGHITRA